MPATQSFKITSLSPPPSSDQKAAMDAWLGSVYTTLTQLIHGVGRIKGNQGSQQGSQETGSNPTGTQTEINVNALRPEGVLILVDGVIYPFSVEGVNAALQKASSKGGGSVLLPPAINIPVYTTSVKIPNRCRLSGVGTTHDTVATFTANANTSVSAMIENLTQDGTQHYAAVENIALEGNKGSGAVVSAGVKFVSVFNGSFIRNVRVGSPSGVGFLLDGKTAGFGPFIMENVLTDSAGSDGIRVMGTCGTVQIMHASVERFGAGRSGILIDVTGGSSASIGHVLQGIYSEGDNATGSVITLNGVAGVTVDGVWSQMLNAASVIKITSVASGFDGAFGGAGHVFRNITAGAATVMIDDQVAGVTVNGSSHPTEPASRFLSHYESPVATTSSGTDSRQMYGIQPQRQGPTTASGTSIQLIDGSYFPITGVTQIENFLNAARFKGKLMVTKMTGALNLAHNAGGTGNLRLDGGVDYTTAADTRTLWFSDGTNWWEVCRASAAGSGSQYLRRDGGNTVTGTIDWNNFSVTNWRGSTASAGGQVEIVSNLADAAAVGLALRWNRGAAPANGRYALGVYDNDATGARPLILVGYQSSATGVIWSPDKDGGGNANITSWAWVVGETNDPAGGENCAIRMYPDGIGGTALIDFYVAGDIALRIRKSGQQAQFADGYSFNFEASAFVTAGERDVQAGTFRFGYQDGLANASGFHTAFYDGNLPADTLDTGRVFGVAYEGSIYLGKPGRTGTSPVAATDGLVASGWVAASSANNQAGVDLPIKSGRGTGNSTTGGALRLYTPDAGSSGTTLQSWTEKAALSRLGAFTGISAGSNIGLGLYNPVGTFDAGATDLLTVGTDNQIQFYDFDVGSGGAYTVNIDLDTAGAVEGSAFWLRLTKAASTDPTINVRNGSGGANIISINDGIAEDWGCIFVFDGTNWIRHVAVINDI